MYRNGRRRKRAKLLPLVAVCVLAVLVLRLLAMQDITHVQHGEHGNDDTVGDLPRQENERDRNEEASSHGQATLFDSPDTPIAVAPGTSVPRGQSFFYSYPESNRLGSFETWRPKELLSRSMRLENKRRADDNVLIVMQTSSHTVWRNVPTQLMTLLREFTHYSIYSQSGDAVLNTEVVDALALLDPNFVAKSPHLESYRIMRIVRDSHVNIPLDEIPVSGAAALARFVTLPMLQHAYTHNAEHDWYVAVLDSTHVFAPNLREILASLDPNEPIYLGSAIKGPEHVFADIGSGIVLSREAMRRTFSGDTSDIQEFSQRTAVECCGDYVLAMYLKEKASIELDVSLSGGQFQGNPANKVPVSARNWCQRIVSTNQQHPRELDMLTEYAQLKHGRPVMFSDVYYDFIKPYLHADSQENWDNGAVDLEFGANHIADTEAHKSLDECRAACTQRPQCLMLRYDAHRQYCGLGMSTVSLGAPIVRYDTRADEDSCQRHGVRCNERTKDEPTTSEWFIDRIRAMRQSMPCDPLNVDVHSEGTEYGALDQVEGWWHRARRLAQDGDPLRQS